MAVVKGLRERLRDGEKVVCAEGYLWELERRGFVCSGDFTPEVMLDYPERVKALHEEFVMAGSDVVVAYTYYGNKAKLTSIGREKDYTTLNLDSLKMARDVADAYGRLMAGNICNTTDFNCEDKASVARTQAMFKEQIEWAVEARADYMIAETFNELAEAKVALKAIQDYGNGMPAVVTMGAYSRDTTLEGVPITQALRELEEMGATVVGLNCSRGPTTMLPLLTEVRKACKGPVAALPVPYRTNEKEKGYCQLTDPLTGKLLWPSNLECRLCCRSDIRKFAEQALDLGINYIGLCCGSSPSMLREIAQVFGKNPELSRFAPNTSRNYYLKTETSPKALAIKELLFGDMTSLM